MIKIYQKNSEMKLSENFMLSEFHCHCKYSECTITYLDTDLIDYLQGKRTQTGKYFHINDGFRCTRHNQEVGGKPGSYHQIGKAADLVVEGFSVSNMGLLFYDAHGMGIYPTKGFVHVDVRGYHARWRG